MGTDKTASRALAPGTTISLRSEGRAALFVIESVIDGGGSCVAYNVTLRPKGPAPVYTEFCSRP